MVVVVAAVVVVLSCHFCFRGWCSGSDSGGGRLVSFQWTRFQEPGSGRGAGNQVLLAVFFRCRLSYCCAVDIMVDAFNVGQCRT